MDPLDKVIPKIGDRIARYEITQELGRGGFGIVYKARQAGLDADVAIKLLIPQLSDGAGQMQLLERFEQEARVIKGLEHPAALKVRDFGRWNGLAYLVTEFVRGTTLEEVVRNEAPLTPLRIARIVRQVLGCLAEAHYQRVVHRDLKPANIMLRDIFGSEDAVKVLDFGIAKVSSDGGVQTMTGMRFGTPWYMAPEQCRGMTDLDGRVDLYALGLIMGECMTGRRVVQTTDMMGAFYAQATPDPVAFEPIVRQSPLWPVIHLATQKEREHRYPDALSMRAGLDALTAGSSFDRWPVQPPPPAEFVPPVTLITPKPPVLSTAQPAPDASSAGSSTSAAPDGPASFGSSVASSAPPEERRRGPLLVAALVVLAAIVFFLLVSVLPGTPPGADDAPTARTPTARAPTAPAAPPRTVEVAGLTLRRFEAPRLSGGQAFYLSERPLLVVDHYYGCLSHGECANAVQAELRTALDTGGTDPATQCFAGDPEAIDHPLNCLTQRGAAALCEFMGLRLPTAAEAAWAGRTDAIGGDIWLWTSSSTELDAEKYIVFGGRPGAGGPGPDQVGGEVAVRGAATPSFMGARCALDEARALALASDEE